MSAHPHVAPRPSIERIEPMPAELCCPCGCTYDDAPDEPAEMVVVAIEGDEVACCLLCVAVGYVCRLVKRETA